jgi:hypothetical protein
MSADGLNKSSISKASFSYNQNSNLKMQPGLNTFSSVHQVLTPK